MDDSGSPILFHIILFFVFLVLDAILYAYGAAVQSISESDIERQQEQTDLRKIRRIQDDKENPENLINTIQIASNLLCVLSGSILVHAISSEWFGFLEGIGAASGLPFTVIHSLTLALSIFIIIFFIYIFGIHVPKILGAYYAEKSAFGLSGIIHVIVLLFKPLTGLVILVVKGVMKLLGIDPDKLQEDVTEEEILSMVNEGHEQGVLEASEAEMINNIFEFGDKDAQDIMVHRKNIVAVDGTLTLKDALNFMLHKTNTRFPVYEDNIDNITGILHLKDTMKFHTDGVYDNWLVKDVPDLIRPAVFIPETRNIHQLFKNMQSKKIQMVIVADEYGQTAGLVAMEDILEEIVGNIQDEYDEEEEMIKSCGDTGYLMNGMTPLEEVKDTLGVEFDLDEDIETLNGMLISRLDKIPAEDENSTIEEMGFAFQILSVANKTIEKVRVWKLPEIDGITENTEVS